MLSSLTNAPGELLGDIWIDTLVSLNPYFNARFQRPLTKRNLGRFWSVTEPHFFGVV